MLQRVSALPAWAKAGTGALGVAAIAMLAWLVADLAAGAAPADIVFDALIIVVLAGAAFGIVRPQRASASPLSYNVIHPTGTEEDGNENVYENALFDREA